MGPEDRPRAGGEGMTGATMPTIRVEAQVSGSELLEAVEQLSPAEFQRFVADVLGLRARRESPQLSAPEAELLMRINQGLPEELRRRLDDLIAKRQARVLTPDEHAELLRLTDEVENLEVDRLEALVELARLRGTSLAAVMQELGITAPAHG
jgi:hypothetical protein